MPPLTFGAIPGARPPIAGMPFSGFKQETTPKQGGDWKTWAIPAAIAGGTSLLGAWINARGQGKTNEANARLAREQMDFQERMSNTAHQREVKDYEAAGLNPSLGYHSGGSSTPTGSSARMENELAGYAGSAAAAANAFQSIASTKANIDATEAQTDRTKAETTQLQLESASRLEQMQGLGRTATTNARFLEKTFDPRVSVEQSGAFTAAATRLGKEQEVANIKQLFPLQLQQLREQIAATIQGSRNTAAHARLAELAEPTAENIANAAKTTWGRKVAPFLNDAQTSMELFRKMLMMGGR